jgi:parvulin-like peptidyl-prolyl isomerase
MENLNNLLTIGEEALSLKQVLGYLQRAGSLQKTLGDVLRQYVIEMALQQREDLTVDSFQVDQAILNFRLEHQLSDLAKFQDWLKTNDLTYEGFQQKVGYTMQLALCKQAIAKSDLEEYFAEQKPFFDRVVLSRIVVAELNEAEQLKQVLEENPTQFGVLAQAHSLAPEAISQGMMGSISYGTLPEELKGAIADTAPGMLIGPLELNDTYGLFRVEQFLDAELNEQTRSILTEQLFEQWLQSQLQGMKAKLHLG